MLLLPANSVSGSYFRIVSDNINFNTLKCISLGAKQSGNYSNISNVHVA